MITLRHAIKVAASRPAVYQALTDMTHMAAWHHGEVSGDIAVGKVLTLTPKPGTRFGWRTETLVQNEKVVQVCTEGSGTSSNKCLTFKLSDADDGRTLVELFDGEWERDDPHLPFCNAHWGDVIFRLKAYVEQTPSLAP